MTSLFGNVPVPAGGNIGIDIDCRIKRRKQAVEPLASVSRQLLLKWREFDEIKTIRAQQYSSSEQVLKSQRSYGNHRYGVTAIVATGLRQSSLRSYGNHRYGVTAIVATELRQMPLRNR